MIKMLAIGHLGNDAVVNIVNGKNVINFNVAHSEKYKDAQGTVINKTVWVQCNYWTDKTAIAPYLKKGTQVYVEGQPEVNLYQGNDGKWNATQRLRVASIQLLGSKKENEGGGSGSAPASAPATTGGFTPVPNSGNASDLMEPIDDLPF